jgi:hypothetical protein
VTRSACTWTIVATAAIVVGAGIYSARLIHHGFSAREKPMALEAFLVRRARRWAIPAEAKHLKNPMPTNAETLEHGRNHWADHCATCHANNGSGETEIGRGLYPRAPDMRQPETQSLSDGELYNIIRNGRIVGIRIPARDGHHTLRDQFDQLVLDLFRLALILQRLGDSGSEVQSLIGSAQQNGSAVRAALGLIKPRDHRTQRDSREQNTLCCGMLAHAKASDWSQNRVDNGFVP